MPNFYRRTSTGPCQSSAPGDGAWWKHVWIPLSYFYKNVPR